MDLHSDPHPLSLPSVFDCSDRSRIQLTGADRVRYLNGQVSQNVSRLPVGQVLPACITNAKGRMQAEVWITVFDSFLVVDSEPELAQDLEARLQRYIISDDVEMVDISGRDAVFHLIGEDVAQVPLLAGFPCMKAHRLGTTGWDVWVPLEKKADLQEALGSLFGTPETWEVMRVERGIPKWGAELTEDTLPPEAGLEGTHIDYHKGCYIGQEVISRLKSVGHVNRTLVRLRGAADSALPIVGASLIAKESPQTALVVTSVARLKTGEVAALGYLKRGCEAHDFEGQNGVRLHRI